MIAIENFFSFRVDWHQDQRARPLVHQYQVALDSVLESHPRLRPSVTYCVHCQIRFLTHPRNAGRRDLRCPFGCRQHHRRQRSQRRSTAYYQTACGKLKKRRLNARRSGRSSPPVCELQDASQQPSWPVQQPPDEWSVPLELALEGVVLRESALLRSPMLSHVRMLVWLIEGIQLSCQQVVSLLGRALRQHSIAYQRRTDYLLRFLHQHPP